MGAFCSRAVSPLWTYFQSRVIIAGTAPQDENLIPNRICLDSWISPHWDLLQKTAGPLLDPHHGKLCCLLPLVNLQPLLSKFEILPKTVTKYVSLFWFWSYISFVFLCVCVHVYVCVIFLIEQMTNIRPLCPKWIHLSFWLYGVLDREWNNPIGCIWMGLK